MATWIQPKTDWQNYDHVTFQDINRIMGNCNFLYKNDPHYVSALPTNYTDNSFVILEDWQKLLTALRQLQIEYGVGETDASTWTTMTAQNFYNVENFEWLVWLYKYTNQANLLLVSDETLMIENTEIE